VLCDFLYTGVIAIFLIVFDTVVVLCLLVVTLCNDIAIGIAVFVVMCLGLSLVKLYFASAELFSSCQFRFFVKFEFCWRLLLDQ